MVRGVTRGYEKKLELVGVGFRAQVQGKSLNLTLGFSHPVNVPIPEGISIETPSQTEIVVKGIDRQKVGQIAAEIRDIRPQARAVQGQGCALRRRADHPQRGQEEMIITKKQRRLRRAVRTRAQIRNLGFARLTVHRTPKHIYAQVTDPAGAKVIATASTLQKAVREGLKTTGNVDAAKAVGRAIATRAKAAGVSKVAFDRSGFQFHGRVKALADAAREAGLEF